MQREALTWKPHRRQAAFLEIPDSIFEAMYGGAAGGGKSETLLNLPLVRGFYENPRFKGLLLRRTYPELEAELIVRSESQGFYKALGARYNQEKKRWVFPSGSILQFGHLEYDKDVRKYDSAEYNYIGFDELTSFTEYQYKYMISRCRSSSPDLPAIMRSGTNPGNIGHAWVRGYFIEDTLGKKIPPGTIIIDKVTGLKRIFIQSKAQDNPHLMENDPQYVNRLMGMAEKDRKAKLDGDWYTFSGQVFDDFREEHFPGEPDFAIHVISDFKVPDWWPKFLAIDWGYAAMTCALWGCVSPEGRLIVYREGVWKQTKVSSWGADVARMSEGEVLRDIVICQSASQQRGDELTILQQFEKASGLRPRLSGNLKGSRVSGKILIQELLRWREKPNRKIPKADYSEEVAQKILRIAGLKAYNDYLLSFRPEPPEINLPKLQIVESCVTLRKTIPLCVYDDDKKEDVAEFSGDDPYDSLRYLAAMYDGRTWEVVHHEAEKLVQVDAAIQNLQRTQDWTSYYRKMERLERKSSSYARPLRRMRRAA